MQLRGLFLLAILTLAVFPGGNASADGDEPPDGFLTFCRFGPKMRVLYPTNGEKTCEATAHIQGLIWECAPPEKVSERVDGFRSKLVQVATEECEKFCHNVGRKCLAKFVIPAGCGLQTDLEEAIAAGKKFGCRNDCGGKAFTFCSIYDAGYNLEDKAMIQPKNANCFCSAEDAPKSKK